MVAAASSFAIHLKLSCRFNKLKVFRIGKTQLIVGIFKILGPGAPFAEQTIDAVEALKNSTFYQHRQWHMLIK